jgi:clan AA aspartic protease
MITGVVVFCEEGRIRLKVRGSRGREQEVEAVVDTGYTGALSLPPNLIQALGLSWQNFDRGILADGSKCRFDVYEGKVIWDGRRRDVTVHEFDADPLIGMGLLKGYELKMQVRPKGKIAITKL